MPNPEKILLIEKAGNLALAEGLAEKFDITTLHSIKDFGNLPESAEYRVLLFGPSLDAASRALLIEGMTTSAFPGIQDMPFVIVSADDHLKSRLDALQAGCDDYVVMPEPSPQALEEVATRIGKVIFLRIANAQLQSQLRMANEAAFSAMTDTSNLGINIQFMLESFDCDNLDQLGMLLFHSLDKYGLRCSLQMRGRYQVKNMEPNGMAKEMEANLLDELKDAGRYYDFGKRTVMNYESVSLLVKNMPIDDERRYGAVKDNIFSLLQGVNARVKAINDKMTLDKERELLELLANRLKGSFANMDEAYQALMRALAETVDNMADKIEQSVMSLGLTENQENTLDGIISEAQKESTELFSQGIRVDEEVKKLIDRIAVVFEFKGKPEFFQYLDRVKKLIDQ